MLREYGLDNIYVTTQNDTVYALLSDRALADPDDLIAQWKDERTRQWNDVYAGEMLAQVRSVAKGLMALGAKPGLWYRPLRAWDELPEEQRLIADRNYLDPTVPAVGGNKGESKKITLPYCHPY